MKNFSQITDVNYQESNVNEIVGILLASACLAYACGPLLSGIGERISKGGDKKEGGATFWDWLLNRNKDKKDEPKSKDDQNEEPKEKSKKEPKDDQNKEPKKDDKEINNVFNSLLLLSRKANQNEKDKNTKKKNDALIKLLTACSFDKDGNEIPLEERINKMKDSMTPEQFEAFKKDMSETYEKVKDDDKFKDAIKKAKENITPEQYDNLIEEAKKEAKSTLETLEKEREEIEKYEKQLNELDEKINGAKDPKDEEIKKLKTELEELKKNPPQTMTSEATGVSVSNEPKPKDEPKEKTKEEKDAEIKKIDDKYKEDSKALEKEYEEKIKKETDKDKKEALEQEWMKKEKALRAQMHKDKDNVDDNDDHDTEKDETKNGKYEVKDEEITDPETGEKIKVKTYTGPRGGKFYYPKGKPKKPENKVYVHESIRRYTSLTSYLLECLG